MQWRLLNSGCQLNAYILQNPTTRITANPEKLGVALAILNDSASDPYWSESNGGQTSDHLL
jgi:hypothetical protein